MAQFFKLIFLLVFGLVLAACQSSPYDNYRVYDNPGKIKAIHHFDQGRAVAITQEDRGTQGGIFVGKRYAIAPYTRLKLNVSSYIKDGEALPDDSYMYLDIYDLASKSLKSRRIDLFKAVKSYKSDFLPRSIPGVIYLINGTEYLNINIIKDELDSDGEVVLSSLLLNLDTGKLIDPAELKGTKEETSFSTRLSTYTNFDERIAKYGFHFGAAGQDKVTYDIESGVANTKLNLIQENPKLKKMLYEDGGAVYLLQREEATEEELTNMLLHWFSTPQKRLEVDMTLSDHSTPVRVSSYQEINQVYEDAKSSPSSTPSER